MWRKRWAAWLLPMLLQACATSPPGGQHLTHDNTLPPRTELTETPFFPQTRYHCGPAALATVLTHHGLATTPQTLAEQLYIPELKGSLQAEMIATARDFDVLVMPLESDLNTLLHQVANGTPVLVMQNLGLNALPRWHYAVVVGYDLDQQTITLRSGKRKQWTTPLKVFDRTWRRAGRWALLIVPPNRIPHGVDAADVIRAASALETNGHLTAAHTAFQLATEQWPDNRLAHMGLGNTAYALRDPALAAQAFSKTITLNPQSPAGWNNLAYALAAQGCDALSLQAALCALRLAPEDDNYRHTVEDIKSKMNPKPGTEPVECALPRCPAGTTPP